MDHTNTNSPELETCCVWFEESSSNEYQRVALLCQLAGLEGPSKLIESDPARLASIITGR